MASLIGKENTQMLREAFTCLKEINVSLKKIAKHYERVDKSRGYISTNDDLVYRPKTAEYYDDRNE